MKISVLYGTETGNAEMLAEDMMAELESDHDVDCKNLSDMQPGAFDPDVFYLLVCSTYGDGELPASAQPFSHAMLSEKPDLCAIHFAVFGLGDMEYAETFNHGPKKLAELMTAHGAIQVGERAAHDASSSDLAEDFALPWAQQVVEQAAAQLSQAA
ncbi:MAG: flavodoxin domain-containing protein [Pseudomonadota bacterium]